MQKEIDALTANELAYVEDGGRAGWNGAHAREPLRYSQGQNRRTFLRITVGEQLSLHEATCNDREVEPLSPVHLTAFGFNTLKAEAEPCLGVSNEECSVKIAVRSDGTCAYLGIVSVILMPSRATEIMIVHHLYSSNRKRQNRFRHCGDLMYVDAVGSGLASDLS
jgi:hypothetical protein